MKIKKETIGWTISSLLLIANTVDNILTKDISKNRIYVVIVSAVICVYCIYQLISSLRRKPQEDNNNE